MLFFFFAKRIENFLVVQGIMVKSKKRVLMHTKKNLRICKSNIGMRIETQPMRSSVQTDYCPGDWVAVETNLRASATAVPVRSECLKYHSGQPLQDPLQHNHTITYTHRSEDSPPYLYVHNSAMKFIRLNSSRWKSFQTLVMKLNELMKQMLGKMCFAFRFTLHL